MIATLDVGRIVPATEAEGPYRRFAVWVAGCTLSCPGCCNPELLDRATGRSMDVGALLDAIASAVRDHDVEGVTALGGEPLEQMAGVAALCAEANAMGLGTIVFTGHTLAEARALPGFDALWPHVDTLVDGRFVAGRPEPRGGRRFIGSSNQRLVHRTDRYADPDLWRGPGHAEIRIAPDGTTSVHGHPQTVQSLLRSWR